MRTLLVSGNEPVPGGLEAIVRQGSTSVDHVSGDDLVTYVSREGLGVDRIVFWAGREDRDVRSVALNYATAAGAARKETVFFVTGVPTDPLDGMTKSEVYVWPADEDRLKKAFLVTA
jgi:hypothetical protein